MWPFKSKSKVKSPPYWSATPEMTKESVGSALLCIHGRGARLALMYAKMQGFEHETLSVENLPRFIQLVSSDPIFSEDALATSAAFLRLETDELCRIDRFEDFAFDGREVDCATRADVLTFRAAVQKASVSEVFSHAGFDPREWLVSITVALRAADLDAISIRLEDRKPYLRPLLLRANANGLNKYGEIDRSAYFDEIESFLSHSFPEGSLRFFYTYAPLSFALGITDQWLEESIDGTTIPSDGHGFEVWCAEHIRTQGWDVSLTDATGDQGVDILARKPDLCVAIQCKRYDGPIGNKAVQEALAGKIHYGADVACVVGTGGFTKSARDLSLSTGVILIDATSVRDFSGIVVGR